MSAANSPVAARAQAEFRQGLALHQEGRLAEAQAIYRQVLKIQPEHFDALHLLGVISYQTGNLLQAVDLIGRAIELNPSNAAAYSNHGLALQGLQRPDEALDSYDRALKLKPDYAEAYSNRGNALKDLKRLDEALDSYDRALELKPDYVEALSNRGLALKALKRLDEALESYDRALKLKPDFADGHLNLALCRLLMGEFARGWEGFEWRWESAKIERQLGEKRNFTQPLWLGVESLQGKTILLHSDQGLGDALQFCRYASLVRDLGARVILEVPEPLMALLSNLAGVAQLVEKGGALPSFDYHCPLLSLPLAFKTDLNTIPSFGSYIASNPGKVTEWRAKLGKRTKPRIGLAWRGSALHANDRNRSIALGDIVEHLPGQLQYVSLQKEVSPADRETLFSHTEIQNFGEQLSDFTDTAALCELMDVVVSVDTSVAHLAGAMGRPVWILLPFIPDWRWLLDREDSVWYPSARLFRQDSAGDWPSVIDKVRTELLRGSTAR